MKNKNKKTVVEIKPPSDMLADKDKFGIFVAGSIEQGKAIEWQKHFYDEICKMRPVPNVIIYNPRRDNWDNTWDQSSENKILQEQIEWELEHLEKAHLVVMFLQPGTMSPISLLELGLYARDVYAMKKQMIVLCPEGFHRKANVDVTCMYYDIPMAKDMKDLIKKTKTLIRTYDKDAKAKMEIILKKISKKSK
jgi:hypothetical protein